MLRTIDDLRDAIYNVRVSIGADEVTRSTASKILGQIDGLDGNDTLTNHPRTYQRLEEVARLNKRNSAIDVLTEYLSYYHIKHNRKEQ